MRCVLILGAGEIQVPVIQKAKDLGLYTIVADFDPNAPGFDFADEKAVVSTIDLEKVNDLAKEKKHFGYTYYFRLSCKYRCKSRRKFRA